MDDKSKYAHLFPIPVNVEQGCQYRWCGCGQSSTEPFCDKDNCSQSVKYVADMNDEVQFCGCKQTKTPPFCDGSHGRLLLEALKSKQSNEKDFSRGTKGG